MNEFHPTYLLNAAAYAAAGILLFAIAFTLITRITPFNLWKEVSEGKNLAVAVLVGAMCISMAIIIASAVH